jgi:hypothetical protein
VVRTVRHAVVVVVAVLASARHLDAEPAAVDLAVIVNTENAVTPSMSALEGIFLRRQMFWEGGARIIPLNAAADTERRRRFDRAVLGMTPDEVARHWVDQRIRGAGTAPREVDDAFLTIKLVARLKVAIGYVPADSELRGVRIVARIHDNKLVSP